MRVHTDIRKQAVQIGRFDLELLDGCSAGDKLSARGISASVAFPNTSRLSYFGLFVVAVSTDHMM